MRLFNFKIQKGFSNEKMNNLVQDLLIIEKDNR
jgi:hypothetical protein